MSIAIEMEPMHLTAHIVWNGMIISFFLDPIPCGISIYHLSFSLTSRTCSGLLQQVASGRWYYESNNDYQERMQIEIDIVEHFLTSEMDKWIPVEDATHDINGHDE